MSDKTIPEDETKVSKKARGVRFEPDEEAWLEGLERKIFEGQTGARSSFSAAVREAVTWGRAVLGEERSGGDCFAALRRLQARDGGDAQATLRRVIEAGLKALEVEQPTEGGAQ